MENFWKRQSRRDGSNHVVGNPTNKNVSRLTAVNLTNYEKALNQQIENDGSLSSERKSALAIAKERLEEAKAKLGL